MKLQRRILPAAVAGALAAGMMGVAFAQQATPPATDKKAEEKVDRIEVTGSRIPSANLDSTSPITTIDAAAIKVEGLRSVENLLNNLPQVFAAQGATISNAATGTATVNLRGLGDERTLVLVNGRRLPAGTPRAGGSYAADLNQIPAPLIKRVEILTGGAGAVYGSDAVAGVVNFIMNDKFEGIQIDTSYSFYQHNQNGGPVADMIRARALTNSAEFKIPGDISADGKIGDFSLLMGSNFANNKGNATLFFGYKKEEALLQSERDFSACSIGNSTSAASATINGTAFGPGFRCGGSGTSFPGRFLNLVTGANRTVANAAGGTRAWVAANDQYNFGPLNYFQRPSERYQFNGYANYDLTDTMKLYTEVSFHDDRTVAQIAPSGAFGFDASGANAVRCDNPLLSADWRRDLGCTGTTGVGNDLFIFRRNVEGGGRQDDIRHTSFRFVAGIKGELGKSWGYDAYMTDAKVVFQETYKNDFSIARTALALDAVRDASGAIVCRSGPPCVPYNIWSLGGVVPGALAYVSTPGFQKGSTEQKVQGINLNGDLTDYGFKMPSAKNGVGVAFGLERRVERLQLDTDSAFSTGDLAGQGGPTIGLGGSYTVNEIYAEVRAPLIEGKPMAELLSVNGSWRNSDYSLGPRTDSYGFGIEWAPVKEVRGRASVQQAVRSANILELFSSQAIELFDLAQDPCGPSRTATLAQCQRTGVTAANYGSAVLDSPAGQYNTLGGGNPKLAPEESDSYTIGAVFQIGRNFTASIDYFSVEVDKVIGTAPPGTILNQCLQTGAAQFCNAITRDRVGTLWATPQGFITATNQNLGRLTTKGFDINLDYFHKLATLGALKFNMTGTLLKENISEPIKGLGEFDCTGLHGATCGVPTPEWRHKFRTTWETPWNVDVSLTWRHIGAVDQEGTNSSPQLRNTALAPADRTLEKRDYFDISGNWKITKKITVTGGINNLFDKDPPLSGLVGAGFGNGNTYPQVYDALGRRVFVNLTARF